jgi:predicted urease superfamily metal-dependent hydrolase
LAAAKTGGAARFLTERTYVDDATARADTLEELQKLPREMEEIAA